MVELKDAHQYGVKIMSWAIDVNRNGDLGHNYGEEGIFYYKDQFWLIQFDDEGIFQEQSNKEPLDLPELEDELRIGCEQYLIKMDDLLNKPRPKKCLICEAESDLGLCLHCEIRIKETKGLPEQDINCQLCEYKWTCQYIYGNCPFKAKE